MFGTWVVAAAIRFTSNADQALVRLASQTRMANAQFARQNQLINSNQLALIRYQERLAAVRAEQMRMLQVGAGVGAAIGFAAMGTALSDAGKLELVLRGIQNVTEATSTQMERLYQASFNLGSQYGLNATQVAEMFREIGRQTQGQVSFSGMLSILPYATQLQSVLGPMRGMNPQQTVDTALSLMHLFRKYNVKNMTPFFDTFARLMELTPATPTQLVRQFTYVEPLLKGLNVPDEQAATIMLMLTRAGFASGKGATGLANLVQEALGSLQMTGHAQAGKAAILRHWGILNKDGTSPFFQMGATDEKKTSNLFAFLRKIAEIGKTDPNAIRDIFGVFGKQGGRIGALFADPVMVKAFEDLAKAMTTQKSLSLASQSENIMSTMFQQWNRLKSNFTSLWTELAYPWLGQVARVFGQLADQLHALQVWLHSHKREEKLIGGALAGGTFLMAGVASFGALSFLSRLLGLGGMAGSLGPRLNLLGGFLGMLSGFLRGLATMNLAALRDGGQILGAFGVQLRTWIQPFLEMVLGVVGIPGKRMGRAGIGGVNWAVHGLGGGLARLGTNLAGGSNFFGVLLGRMLTTGAGIGPGIAHFFESLLGVAGIPGKRMGRAGIFGVNWMMRGLGGGTLALAERMAGGSNFLGVLLGRIIQTIFGGTAAIAGALPVLRTVLGRVFTRFIPIVGEILLAVDLIRMLMPVWDKYKGQVAYTLGYVFGSIAKMVVDSVRSIFSWLGSVLGAIRANPALFIANPSAVMGGVQGPDLLGEAGRGLRSGYGGHTYQPRGHEGSAVHLHGDIILHLDGPHQIGPTLDALRHLKGNPSVRTAPFQPLNFSVPASQWSS